jgi:hypothetical protein
MLRIFAFLVFVILLPGCSTTQPERPKPNPVVFKAVRQAVRDYADSENRAIISITANVYDGTVRTNWFPVNKGETEVKVDASVVGERYSVEAWQRPWGIVRRPYKSARTRHAESYINKRIERLLKQERRSH